MYFYDDFYLNFHAHQQIPAEKEIVIQSLFLQKNIITKKSDNILFTAGLHPWHANLLDKKEIKFRLQKLINLKSIIAVGETGLDKLKGCDWDMQMEVLKTHIDIANEYNLPIIIHSVKSHNEILKLRKESKSKAPWAIHHFNGSKQMALDFIDNGFYLSVCQHIKSKNSKLSEYFGDLPIDRIFLETDDFKIDIKDLYKIAAAKYKISTVELRKQLISNLNNFLNEK